MNLEKTKKVIGLNTVLKKLHSGELKEVMIASNCSKEIEDKLNSLSKVYDIPINKVKEDSQKLGIMCKKTYNISVIGILKQ